ncbi:hypothetical protein [Mesorhizobium sp. 2RAF21]|uniref:hypothetical protein n=1 Tax=Mesorhizobium sp. 2RAF21 TaxID=3232995 RepID=UPI003F9B9729
MPLIATSPRHRRAWSRRAAGRDHGREFLDRTAGLAGQLVRLQERSRVMFTGNKTIAQCQKI